MKKPEKIICGKCPGVIFCLSRGANPWYQFRCLTCGDLIMVRSGGRWSSYHEFHVEYADDVAKCPTSPHPGFVELCDDCLRKQV